MNSKLWKKLLGQAIPFFVMVYMAFAVVWVSADYVLAACSRVPVGELTVQIAQGIPIAIIAYALSSVGDHWLQDHYKVDNEGKPRLDGVERQG